ncbi:MAG: DUF5666 domain-containing protein [Thiolinea sp.]
MALCLALFLQACNSEDVSERQIAARESGIGGTGISNECSPDTSLGWKPGGSGLGGTGLMAENGLGGTGIVGVINGFGSICVNGVKVEYTADTPIWIDGKDQRADALRLGQVVFVQTKEESRTPEAKLIEVNHALSGPVNLVEADRKRFTVIGGTVEWNDKTLFADVNGQPLQPEMLKAGMSVAVNGLWKQEGLLEATRVDVRPASGMVSVTGFLHSIADDWMDINGMSISVARDELCDMGAEGYNVRVTGLWDGSYMNAYELAIKSTNIRSERLNTAGYVSEDMADGGFRMADGSLVSITGNTEILGSDKVKVGDRVWVYGRVASARNINAEQIRVFQ